MVKEITIKSFNGIGDALFMTPTLPRIKEAYPETKITVNTNCPTLFRHNPFVDYLNKGKDGVFLGYPDPIHNKLPTEHHIISDWRIIANAYKLNLRPPRLQPEIYFRDGQKFDKIDNSIGVQLQHKGHWHNKKVWPFFKALLKEKLPHGFRSVSIPTCQDHISLAIQIKKYDAVVCAEGGISHIAKAVGVPAIVVYGGFASPEWNGYESQINLTKTPSCAYCYGTAPCKSEVIERECLRKIEMKDVLHAVSGLRILKHLTGGNAMRFVQADASYWCKGKGVDVGAGKWPLPGARPIDQKKEEHASMINEKSDSLDFVFSSHCLEHLTDPVEALIEWYRILKPGGKLYLYLPHPHYQPWRKENLRFHLYNFYPEDIQEMLKIIGFSILKYVEKDEYFGHIHVAKKRKLKRKIEK